MSFLAGLNNIFEFSIISTIEESSHTRPSLTEEIPQEKTKVLNCLKKRPRFQPEPGVNVLTVTHTVMSPCSPHPPPLPCPRLIASFIRQPRFSAASFLNQIFNPSALNVICAKHATWQKRNAEFNAGQRRRRWPSIKLTSFQHLVFFGNFIVARRLKMNASVLLRGAVSHYIIPFSDEVTFLTRKSIVRELFIMFTACCHRNCFLSDQREQFIRDFWFSKNNSSLKITIPVFSTFGEILYFV